jgi:hypothetical protein
MLSPLRPGPGHRARSTPELRRGLWLALPIVVLVAWDFATATTFLGDDYLFRAFARLESNPWVAFVADKHGGEYYRPIPMLLWWVLERISGGRAWLFALVAFALHAASAVLVGAVGRVIGLSRTTSSLAALLFFVAPAEREAALWFSASTDLLAAVGAMGAFVLFFRGGRAGHATSLLLAVLAFLSKETALVLLLLIPLGSYLRARNCREVFSPLRCARGMLPYLLAAMGYLAARFRVLGGLGGTNDPTAAWWGQGVQLASGLVHALTSYGPLPETAAWLLGLTVLLASLWGARRRGGPLTFALLWVLATLLPLPAAGWVVGARYFYLPAVGLVLIAAMALERAGKPATLLAVLGLAGLGLLCGAQRARDVNLYRAAVATARLGVTRELGLGHRLFLVRGAVKDLDLAIKLSEPSDRRSFGYVVLADVPASFVWLPSASSERLRFVLAQPPLPPSGAYHLGGERIVGQARRDDAPDLAEVLARLPELRIVDLKRMGTGFTWSDSTEVYRQAME